MELAFRGALPLQNGTLIELVTKKPLGKFFLRNA